TGLFPHQTIRSNVATVPRLLGWSRERTETRVGELLELVGLDPDRYAKRYPHELSGGQQQRVGVARALAADPVVLLMDEPFSAVDPIVRVRLQDEFRRLQATVHKTIVLVTHDIDEAVRLGDRIAVLSQGGHLEAFAARAARPPIHPPNRPYTAPPAAQVNAPSRLAPVWMKAASRPATAAAKMYPPQPAKKPRAPTSIATKMPVRTISRIALTSLA